MQETISINGFDFLVRYDFVRKYTTFSEKSLPNDGYVDLVTGIDSKPKNILHTTLGVSIDELVNRIKTRLSEV